jgi:hypothetical protein
MTEEDMFFTHTIVGSALSLPLGHIPTHAAAVQAGLQVDMRNASTSLDQVWKDWVLLQGAYPYAGRHRRAQGALRRSLERHALVIAGLGLVMLLGALLLAMATFGWPILTP